jgi:hypothetical protein
MISKLADVIDLECESAFVPCRVAEPKFGFSAQMTQKSAAWVLSRKLVR